MDLTNSQEEYILAMYLLQEEKGIIRVTDIAKKLEITKPSVNNGINNLKALGLINYERYSDITFSKNGEEIAKEILKKQDIIYVFLKNIIGVEKEKASKESIAMKHAISKDTTDKLDKYISNKFKLVCNHDFLNEKCRNCIKIEKKM